MKKLMLLAAACCFVLASCNNKPAEPATVADQPTEQADTAKCCKKDNPECAAWKDWANQTPEKKAELVKNAIEKINAAKAEKATCEAKKAELEKRWLEIDKLDIEGQKALIDEVMAFCKPCCKKQKGCCKKAEGCQNKEAESCCKKGEQSK
jgi:acyl-CoA reductase-like NAD-dependent aldehyde dehydrogenase